MLSCWNETVPQRPSFASLQAKLDRMLSAEGSNPYIDFSINPNNLCYQVADDTDTPSNGFLHVQSSGNKRRSQLSSQHGSDSSVNISMGQSCHSSSRSLCRTSSAAPKVRWTRTPSPTFEKPRAANPPGFAGEGRRPRSVMLLRSGGGGGGGASQTADDDR